MIRTFLAIEIDEASRRDLVEVQQSLSRLDGKVNWVAPENLHVTMNFLGDVPDEQIAEVCRIAARAAASVQPFEFAIRQPVCIPPRGQQLRMVWSDVDDPTGRLGELHEALDDGFAELGLRGEERKFRPHVTLGRVKFARDAATFREAVAGLAFAHTGPQPARAVVVFSSRLSPDGPAYTPLARPKLGDDEA